jgi:hypothetical protein
MLHAGFFLDIFFDPEDGGDMSSETLVDFQLNTWRYIAEDRTLQIALMYVISRKETLERCSSGQLWMWRAKKVFSFLLNPLISSLMENSTKCPF